MRKSIKKIAASILAATMVLGSMTFASADETTFEEADCANGEVYYTLAGGMTDWAPLAKANQLTETIWDGVYSINIDLSAYTEADEWKNRFKICKIDDVTVAAGGWTGSICLGTNVADDNQTTFRVESTTEAVDDATVYFDVNTGAVVILKDGAAIDYKFSWVGYEAEAGYTDIENFATCGIEWPAEKLKVDETPDIAAGYAALLAKVTGQDLADESLYADGAVKYVVAGGCSPYAWGTTSSANEMAESAIFDGVYEFTMNVPAFDESTEWQNRFKICRLDDVTCGNGWLGSLCLGTQTYDDNQTTFRVENEEEMVVTVIFDSNTGAVYMKDADGAAVDYKFSWVGYDNEVQYTTVSEFATCGYTWPEDKVKTDAPADLADAQAALVAKVNGTDLSDESLYADGVVKYVIAGGCSPFAWGTTSSANEMKESDIKGVYTFKMNVPAFDEEAEWNNRFKVLRLDDITCANGWLGSLCLGTQTYDDNQTTFRLEIAEATEVTVYFQPETGAVVVFDADGNEVDYKFSWVGYDNEVQYTTVSGFATCGYTWPEDKVKTDAPADLADKYAALVKLIKEGPQDETTTAGAADETTTAAPTTTAQNQATQTGDAAPVALLFLLVAAVAVVTVVAKKKEA
jgi:hypothetical protein